MKINYKSRPPESFVLTTNDAAVLAEIVRNNREFMRVDNQSTLSAAARRFVAAVDEAGPLYEDAAKAFV